LGKKKKFETSEILIRLMAERNIDPSIAPDGGSWTLFIADLTEYLSDLERDRDLLEKSLEVSTIAVDERWHHQGVLEKDLLETEAELRALYDASPLGMFVCDNKANISYVNRTFREITGYNPQSSFEKEWTDYVHPEDQKHFKAQWKVLKNKPDTPIDCEIRFLNLENDELIWINLRISAIYIEKNLIGFLGTVDNISERKKAESLLLGGKQVLEMIARNLPLKYTLAGLLQMIESQIIEVKTAIFLIDENRSLTFAASPSMPQDLMLEVGKIKIPFISNFFQTFKTSGQKFIMQDITEQQNWAEYLKKIKPLKFNSIWASPLLGSQREVVGLIALHLPPGKSPQDRHSDIIESFADLISITIERKIFQDNLEREQLRLISSSKMASLGEMAGGISHEIMNPLTIIDGFASRIERMASSQNIQADNLLHHTEKIRSTVTRITKIISSLKAFAREGDRDDFECQSVKKLIGDTLEFCHQKIKHRGISLIIKDFDQSLEIDCRPVQISQVLLNLLNNATDAIEHLAEKWILLEVRDETDRLIIRVTDSGQDLPADVAEKVMKPFFTTKPVGKGTGLGLSVSKSLIEGHNGTLRIDHDIKNTCFVIDLPKIQNREKKAA